MSRAGVIAEGLPLRAQAYYLKAAMAQRLVWRCVRGNSRKFYSLSMERDLWGNRAIVRRWGRLDDTRPGVVVHWDPEASFADMAKAVHRRRTAHHYELVSGSIPQ